MAIAKSTVLETLTKKGLTCANINDYKTLDSILKVKCDKGHEMNLPFRTLRDDRFKCYCCSGKESLGMFIFSSEPPAKSGKRIVAIDNATKHIGISVFDSGKLVHKQLVEFTGETIDRLIANRRYIKNTIIDKWHPDLVVLEDIQLQDNVQTFKFLAMLLGNTEVLLKENGVKYETVLSAKWRKHFMITGTRAADKAKAIDMVMQMYGIVETDDVAEAILLGKYAVDVISATQSVKLF